MEITYKSFVLCLDKVGLKVSNGEFRLHITFADLLAVITAIHAIIELL